MAKGDQIVALAESFGHNLRRARKREDLSQERLARWAGLHRTEIGFLEKGERVCRINTLVRLAGAMAVPVTQLLDGIDWIPGLEAKGRSASARSRASAASMRKIRPRGICPDFLRYLQHGPPSPSSTTSKVITNVTPIATVTCITTAMPITIVTPSTLALMTTALKKLDVGELVEIDGRRYEVVPARQGGGLTLETPITPVSELYSERGWKAASAEDFERVAGHLPTDEEG